MTVEAVKRGEMHTPAGETTQHPNLALHDIVDHVLLAYPLGKTPDKNGTVIELDEDFINDTVAKTNEYIKKKANIPFAKVRSLWSKPYDEIESIPIIKNHDTGNVNGIIGIIKGLIYTTREYGKLVMRAKAVIKDLDAKIKMVSDETWRNTSFGTRADGSVKELSIVINEAIPHGGFEFGEDDNKNTSTQVQLSEKEIQLAEERRELQLAEHELENIIIPNHLILSKLIKTGRLMPWQYDNLIKTENRQALQLMESNLPAYDLGIMFGTNRQAQSISLSEIETAQQKSERVAAEINARLNKKTSANTNTKAISKEFEEMIFKGKDFAETRKEELRQILELSEHSPEIAKKYIKVELGETIIEENQYNDKYLAQYANRLTEIKNKISNLTIQMEECTSAKNDIGRDD